MFKFFSNLKLVMLTEPVNARDRVRLLGTWAGVSVLGFLICVAVAMLSGSFGNMSLLFIFLFCLAVFVFLPISVLLIGFTAVAGILYLGQLLCDLYRKKFNQVIALR